jgi:hypothetical protein
MDKDTLIFIDAYISSLERAAICSNLISQIREYFPEYKIAILNKAPKSYELDSLVDYYFYSGDSILVGPPPQHLLDSELYELAYVYVKTTLGTYENWMPLVGVSDHVASMFNSFILTSRFAKALNYKKVYKIEYDTILDKQDALAMKDDIVNFKDYVLYGKRQEGKWAKPYHHIADIHTIGYSVNLFEDFDIIKTDDDFWSLCNKVNYYGKWIEYIIPSVIDWKSNITPLDGIVYTTGCLELHSNTIFDASSGPGYWAKRWENIPKLCKVSYDQGETESDTDLVIFYWNSEESEFTVNTTIKDSKDNIIHQLDITLNSNNWYIDRIKLTEEIFISTINTRDGKTEKFGYHLTPTQLKDLPTRFIYENR